MIWVGVMSCSPRDRSRHSFMSTPKQLPAGRKQARSARRPLLAGIADTVALKSWLSYVISVSPSSTDLQSAQSYSRPLTSAGGHFRAMIERSTKRKTTAAPAPTATPATTSAERTPTVTPRTVAAAIAGATSVGAGRGLVIALTLPRQSTTYSQKSSHAVGSGSRTHAVP